MTFKETECQSVECVRPVR